MRRNEEGSKRSASQQGSRTTTPSRQQTGQQTRVLPMQTATDPVNMVQKSRTAAPVQSPAQKGKVISQQPNVLQGVVVPQATHAARSFKPLPLSSQGGIMPQPQASQITSRPQLQTQVPQGLIMPQPSKNVITSQAQAPQVVNTPAQQANQFIWMPASAVQPHLPLIYFKPEQREPVFVPASPLVREPVRVQQIPGQPPLLLSAQPMITSVSTSPSEGRKEPSSSSETVSTFTVLPQQVGQSAIQQAQRHEVGSGRQPVTVAPHGLNSVDNRPSRHLQDQGITQGSTMYLNKTQGLPQPTSLVNAVPPLQINPTVDDSSRASFLQPPPGLTSQAAPSQTPASISSASSIVHTSSPLTASPKQHSPEVVVGSQEKVTGSQESPRSSGTERSLVIGEETGQNSNDEKPPLRRAGRTISWRNKTQGKSKLQENRKSLAKDLRG